MKQARRANVRNNLAAALTGATIVLWIVGAVSIWLFGASLFLVCYWIPKAIRSVQ